MGEPVKHNKYKKQFKPWKKKPEAVPPTSQPQPAEPAKTPDPVDDVGLSNATGALCCMPADHMSLADYQSTASRGIDTIFNGGDYERQQMLAILGISSRVGRLCDFLQKSVGANSKDKPPPELVRDTIGEVMWMCAELCTLYGLDIDQVAMWQLKNNVRPK